MADDYSLEINTVQTDEITRMTPRGDIQPLHRVRFRVGMEGPFSIYFSDADYTSENVTAAMEKKAAVIRGYHRG